MASTLLLGLAVPVAPAPGPAWAAPGAEPAVPLCGVTDPDAVTASTEAPPANPTHLGPGGLTLSYFTVANGELYTVDKAAKTIRRFNLDHALLRTITLTFDLATPTIVVDGIGNLYAAQYPATLVKLDSGGRALWSRPGVVAQEIDGLFGIGTGTAFRVGVVGRGEVGSALFDASGTAAGRSDITGTAFSPAPDGGVVATDGAYVRRYDSGGRLVTTFGDAKTANDPQPTGGPFHFYQQGGAVMLPDGSFYVADATRGIEAASPEGFYRGMVPDPTLGSLTERSPLAVVNGRLYFAAGGRFHSNQHLAWISLADMAALVAQPGPPRHVLGFGAGVTTGVTGNHFRAGTAPAVEARFDPWWLAQASRLRLAYSVRDRHQILAAASFAPTVVPLPSTAPALARIPLALPAARPGVYEVDARLLDSGGAVVGATCLTYTVGAPGHRLDFAALPPAPDFGGPTPARGVVLADVLGTRNFRLPVDWSVLLPGGNPGSTGPLNFAPYDGPFADAAREAQSRQVALHVQVGTGTPVEKAMVQNGTWRSRVQQLVSHFRGTVSVWEAWNEPNLTFGAADGYVNQVLRPFAEAVKAADPSARVIGGGPVGMDLAYFDAIGRAGGFSLMDIVAIHPYSGHNRSWEEQGTPDAIRQLRALLATHGAGSKPIWNTESAWWADGPANFLAQADKAARALIWMKTLGVERWNYFMIEGGYGDWGLSYSLIQSAAQPDDYVKPGALATMTAAERTDGRPITGTVDTGTPHTHAVRFGTRPGGTDSVLAAWTDDLTTDATLVLDGSAQAVSGSVTDVLGAETPITLHPGQPVPLRLSGSPLYLTLPAGSPVRLGPPEPFGPNLAAAAAGATASASSATGPNPAERAIDGLSDARNGGDLPGVPGWASTPGDDSRTLTVRLPRLEEVNRVVVSSHSAGSVVPNLRDYDVEVQGEDGSWSPVGRIRNQFFERRRMLWFSPRRAAAIRITVSDVDYGGMAGGRQPWFWATDPGSLADPNATWYGPAVVYEVEAFAGTTGPLSPTLPAPSGLAATGVGADRAGLAWSGSPGATGYTLERASDDLVFAPVASVATTAYTDQTVVPSANYHYRVRAWDSAGSSPPSATVSITTPPAAPVNLRATVSEAGVDLAWGDTFGAAGYNVERATDGTTFSSVATGVLALSFRDTTAAAGTTYQYQVRATNAGGHSAPSNVVTVTLSGGESLDAPDQLVATAASSSEIKLSWASSAGASAYTVARSTDGRSFTVIASGVAATSYRDRGLAPATTYHYVVRATDGTRASAWSPKAWAKTKRR